MMHATLAKYESLKSEVFTEAKQSVRSAEEIRWQVHVGAKVGEDLEGVERPIKVWPGLASRAAPRQGPFVSRACPFFHSFSKPVPAGAGVFRPKKSVRKMVHKNMTEIRARRSLRKSY